MPYRKTEDRRDVHQFPFVKKIEEHSVCPRVSPVGYFCPVLTADGKLDCAPK